jgi:hypothetical protein
MTTQDEYEAFICLFIAFVLFTILYWCLRGGFSEITPPKDGDTFFYYIYVDSISHRIPKHRDFPGWTWVGTEPDGIADYDVMICQIYKVSYKRTTPKLD